MLTSSRQARLALLSVLSLSLAACVQSPTQTPNTTPSGLPIPQIIVGSASPKPTNPNTPVSPSPSSGTSTPQPTATPNTGSTATTVNLPDGTRLLISLPNRFLSRAGQNVQIKVQLFDASGKELPLGTLKVLFKSSRPQDFSIGDSGLVTALKDYGYSTLTISIEGTDLVATQQISVDNFTSGGSSGGGSGSSTPTPTPSTQVNANINFEGLGIGEFQVNTYTTNHQETPSVAVDNDGDFVVTWQSYEQDGEPYYSNIYAQRYNAVGAPQGSEFRVNTYTTNTQRNSSVAVDNDGDFVVTWQSYGQDGELYYSNIYAQRYNAVGAPQGSEFRVNTYTTYDQTNPSIAIDNDGDFVIAWQSDGQDESGYGIYAQRYNANGVRQDSEFQVNTYTTNIQRNSSVAVDNDGDFVISWQSLNQDGSGYGIYAQRYNPTGATQDSEFQVNTYTTHDQSKPSVAIDNDGDFVISWESGGQDGSSYGIYAQRYNSTGVQQGSEFQVNTYTTNAQRNSSVAVDNDGDFVISWQSNAQDGSGYGIYAQRYNSTGVQQGSEFRVNTYTTNPQKNSSVAMDNDGDFVVYWQSRHQDGSEYGVYGKQYKANGMVK